MIAAILTNVNEILTAAIVIIAASILLYNLSRNMRDRVARTSGAVLACVTIAYMADVFIALLADTRLAGPQNYAAVLRLQWIGLAFIPATLFHLSDALLATTGLPSRGRRRFGVRLLYSVSIIFLLMVAFSNLLIEVVPYRDVASLRAGPAFGVYFAYFISATGLAFANVQRARQRCLTRATRRRMGYLQFAMLTPALGTFPYSVILGPGGEFTLPALILVVVANAIVVLMLVFLSYPLSFFGSRIPDRVVKSELLSFFLRGPGTGVLALVTILVTGPATRIFGIDGERFMPFAVVAVVLMWQWLIALALPTLERILVYGNEDSAQLSKLRTLSDRLLSRGDLLQLADAVLQATCNYLQVNSAFVVTLRGAEPEMIASVGPSRPTTEIITHNKDEIVSVISQPNGDKPVHLVNWEAYWLTPLFSVRPATEDGVQSLIGVFGIQARATQINLNTDEFDRLERFVHRLEQTLDDLTLQDEIYAALEGLLPQISMTRTRAAEVEYLPGWIPVNTKATNLPEHDQLVEQVRAALRHYWGGPGLSRSRLLDLEIVKDCTDSTDNPANALRTVLQEAIERLRPEGDRSNTDPEWTLYNILDFRFLQGSKVNEVAQRLAMSHSDFYRKQRVAIEAVATTIENMELEHIQK